MKPSTAVSSSSSVPSHMPARPCSPPHPLCLFSCSKLSLHFQECSPLNRHVVSYLLSCRSPLALPLLYHVSPPLLLCWITYHVSSKILLSSVLKMPRLPRNRYLCRVSTARAMLAVENISCNPFISSSEGHRSSCPIAVPPKMARLFHSGIETAKSRLTVYVCLKNT